MSIEDRLEAITHTLELIAHMQRDAEAKHDALAADTDARLNRLAATINDTNAVLRNLSDVTTDFNKVVAATLEETNTVLRNLSDVTTDFNKSIAAVTLDHAARLRALESSPQGPA